MSASRIYRVHEEHFLPLPYTLSPFSHDWHEGCASYSHVEYPTMVLYSYYGLNPLFCIILSMFFYRLAPRYPTAKQSAWILTTISSAVMTLASIPFLYDYFSNGGSVKYVRIIPNLSVTVCRFFQSFLAM